MTFEHPVRQTLARFSIVALFVVILCCSALSSGGAEPDDATKERARLVIAGMHEHFNEMAAKVGGFSTEQKVKLKELENHVEKSLTADPNAIQNADFRGGVEAQFEAILTDTQRTKFIEQKNSENERGKAFRAMTQLREIGNALLIYSNAHNHLLPPTIGAVVASGDVDVRDFIQVAPFAKLPAGVPEERTKQGEWIDKMLKVTYIGAGKKESDFPEGAVVAYSQAENRSKTLIVLRVDGSVEIVEDAAAEKVVAELQAGKNPPPSMKRK